MSQSVAIGDAENGVWMSEGWWGLAPGLCKVVRAAPLTQRYIYWCATRAGQDFAHEGFMFCMSDQPFTITGDTDCAARGYSEAGFRKADTGATATSYTLVLPALTEDHDLPADADLLTAPYPPGGDAFVQGQQGEPFTQSALMQSCDLGAELVCFLYAEGFRPAAYATQAPDPKAALRAAIQGPWVSSDEADYTFTLVGSELTEAYRGEVLSVAMIVLDRRCPDSPDVSADVIVIYEFGMDPEARAAAGSRA